MKQTGCPVDQLAASPRLAGRGHDISGDGRDESDPPPNKRPRFNMNWARRGVKTQQRPSSLIIIPAACKLFDSYFSGLSISDSRYFISSLQYFYAKPQSLSFLPPSLARFHQLGPWWHTYASPLFHHCVAGPDHASIQARIRQALASLHKLRAPGSADAHSATTRQRTTQSQVGRPARQTIAFQNK